jgi:hypothetical protein
MSRELFSKVFNKSSAAITGAVLLSVVLMLTSGCATIAGKPARAEKLSRAGGNNAGLTGKWYKTGGEKFEYARYAENLGDFEVIEITADQRIKTESLRTSREFDCLVEVSTASEGTITFAPDAPELNIALAAGQTRRTNSCSSAQNSTAATAASSTNYQFKLAENKDGATELCLSADDGKTTCYRREN